MYKEIVNQKQNEIAELYDVDSTLAEFFKLYVQDADDDKLFRINVYKLAKELELNKKALLIHFLYATKVGLFDLNWDVHCPHCDGVSEEALQLSQAKSTSFCSMCEINYNVSFDQSVEVTFTINENIKKVDVPIVCALPDQVQTEIRTEIAKGETRTVISYLEPNTYTYSCPITLSKGTITVENEESAAIQEIEISHVDGMFSPDQFNLKQGSIAFHLKNELEIDAGFFLYPKALPELDRSLLEERVYGFECSNIPEFRQLFADDVLSRRENLQVKDVTILFTDITGSTALYDRLGDAKAYNLVRDHFDILFETVEKNGGVTIKTIGDAVMASFTRPIDGMKAAFEAQKAFSEFNKDENSKDEVFIKIGVHHGPSIVVNLNDRLDYFGTTINLSARIQGLSKSNEILFSEEMMNDLRVKDLLSEEGVKKMKRFNTQVRGLEGNYNIYIIDGSSYS